MYISSDWYNEQWLRTQWGVVFYDRLASKPAYPLIDASVSTKEKGNIGVRYYLYNGIVDSSENTSEILYKGNNPPEKLTLSCGEYWLDERADHLYALQAVSMKVNGKYNYIAYGKKGKEYQIESFIWACWHFATTHGFEVNWHGAPFDAIHNMNTLWVKGDLL